MTMTKPTSEQVTFTAAGSGATLRNLVDKVREIRSVKDFGAVGDGVADDTAAFQAALDSEAYAHVTVPRGNYRITATLNITKQNTLEGQDGGTQNMQSAFITHDAASSGPLFRVTTPLAGVCIKNLTVFGGNGSFCIESSNAGVRYEYLNILNYNGSGIQLLPSGQGSSSSKIMYCRWVGPASATNYTGFQININGGDVWLHGCTAIRGAIGIDILAGQTINLYGCSLRDQSRYLGLSSASQFDTAGIRLSGSAAKQAISIESSYIERCDNGIYVESCESLTINNCLLDDGGVAGIVGAWVAFGNSAINLVNSNARNVTISNNRIVALANGSIAGNFYAIYLNDATRVLVLNNYVQTTGSYNAQFYVTTPTVACVLGNTRIQSGSTPQVDFDPNDSLFDLNPQIPNYQPITFSGTWINAGAAAYNKDHMKFVFMRGRISSGTIPSLAFTLPVGYRPATQCSFPVASNGVLGIVTVATNGQVIVAAGDPTEVDLAGIRFEAA